MRNFFFSFFWDAGAGAGVLPCDIIEEREKGVTDSTATHLPPYLFPPPPSTRTAFRVKSHAAAVSRREREREQSPTTRRGVHVSIASVSSIPLDSRGNYASGWRNLQSLFLLFFFIFGYFTNGFTTQITARKLNISVL